MVVRSTRHGAASSIHSNSQTIYHMDNRMQDKNAAADQIVVSSRFLYRVFAALAVCALGAAICLGAPTWQGEADRLATLLEWRAGSVVADIGAGDGELTVLAVKHVGASGKVYSTELDAQKVAHLEELAKRDPSIKVLRAGEADTNLPAGCCDSIYMRLVYHHLTKPAEIDASLLRALRPGGRLAVIEREPPRGSKLVSGVPKNRQGHGIPQKILIDELTAAGFRVETVQKDWPGSSEGQPLYCVVFKRQ